MLQTWMRFFLWVCLAGSGPSHAYLAVDGDNTTGTEVGSSIYPYTNLQTAVDVAPSGEEIRVAAGDYPESIVIEDKALQLRGGYAGGSAANYSVGIGGDFEVRDTGLYNSHLQGNPENAVVTIKETGCNGTTISGFRVSGGLQGIAFSGWPPLTDITIADNIIEGNGQGATTASGGGGIEVSGTGIRILNNLIRNNRAGKGAGILGSRLTDVVIEGNEIRENVSTQDHGGGIYLTTAKGIFSGNLIDGNETGRDLGYGWGGGIAIVGSGPFITLSNNEFRNNFAGSLGGGVFVDDGSHGVLINNLIHHNRATSGGGGIYVDGLDMSTRSTAEILNCTVANNFGGGQGGNGVIVETSDVVVRNSLIWGNTDYDGNGIGDDFAKREESATLTVDYTLSEQNWPTGGNNLYQNPLFANPSVGDFHLASVVGRWDPAANAWATDLNDSPAIDGGDPTSDFSNETTPNGGKINLGAYGNTDEASRSLGSEGEGYELVVGKTGYGSGNISSTPSGIDCGSDCSEVYADGTDVTLDATPDADSTFAGWSEVCVGGNSCIVTMDQAREVVARFDVADPSQPDLIVQSPGVSDSTLTPEQPYTLSATVKNQGNAAANSTTLRYYRSTDSSITTGDTPIGTDAIGSLAIGATSSQNISPTAPNTPGTYWVGACVDVVTGESSSTNNCSSGVQIVVEDPPPVSGTLICSEPIEDISDASYTTGNYICVAAVSITPNTNVAVGGNASLYLASPVVELGKDFRVNDGGTLAIATKGNFQGLYSGIEQVIIRWADENNRISVLSGQTLETGQLTINFMEGVTDQTLSFSIESGPSWFSIDQQTGSLTINAPVVPVVQIQPFSITVTTSVGSETLMGEIHVSPFDVAETHIASGAAETVTLAGVKLNIPAGEFPAGMDVQVIKGITDSGDSSIIVKSNNGQLFGKQFTLNLPEINPGQNTRGLRGATSSGGCKSFDPNKKPLSETKRYYLYGLYRIGEGYQQAIEFTKELFDFITLLHDDFVITLDDILITERWGSVLCSKKSVDEIQSESVDRDPVLVFHGFQIGWGFGGGERTWKQLLQKLYDTGRIMPFEFRWLTNASFVDVAHDLRETVSRIKHLTGKDVHIVAHSFGGLLARTYLQGLDYGRDASYIPPVASLTTVGAPHSGIFADETVDGFPDGRDSSVTGNGIAFCNQISCWEAGKLTSALGTQIPKAFSTVGIGGIPRALNSSENQFPVQLPVQSLMGLRREVGDSIYWGWPLMNDQFTSFTGGDGLLSFEGQRFRPNYRASVNLLGSQADSGMLVLQDNVLGARVREALLAVDSNDPGFEGSSVSIFEYPGFGHTGLHRICDDGDGGPRKWWVNEALVSLGLDCGSSSQQALEGEVYVRNVSHPLVGHLLYWFEQFGMQILPTVDVTATANASESGAVGYITFQLSVPAPPLLDITISYTLSGTATHQQDYLLEGGFATSITIPSGVRQAVLEIHPVDDSIPEPGGETVVATLQASDYYDLGSLTTATVNIADNDSSPPPPTGNSVLNDTGITTCSNASSNGLSCPQSS